MSTRVRSWMSAPAITVSPDTPIRKAYRIMRERGIRHLPVMDGERLAGIVGDRDVRLHLPPPGMGRLSLAAASLLSTRTVAEAMVPAVTIGPDQHADEAAELMLASRTGAVAVVEDGRLVGIVTTTDLLGAWVGDRGDGRAAAGDAAAPYGAHERA
ncbi:MAG TPA: CBS domain-containing protein [Thermodesulfobacteriota bacterium]